MKNNLKTLEANAKKKTEETIKKVNVAISEMILTKQNINFNSVMKASGVSKSFLYNNIDIKTRIEKIREEQSNISPRIRKLKMTEDSKDVLMNAQKIKIEELKAKVKQLELENQNLKRELYEKI